MMSSTQSEAGDSPGAAHASEEGAPPPAEGAVLSTPFYDHQKRKKTLLLSAIAVFLLVAVVAIPTIVVVGNNKNSSESSGGSGSNNSKNDVESSTNGGKESDGDLRTESGDGTLTPPSPYLQAVMDYFVKEGVTSEQVFASTPASPQRQAAEWLADTDTFFESGYIPETNRTMFDGYRFMARYVMATNYFALGGADWAFPLNFLSEDDICFWNYKEVVSEEEEYDYGVFCGDEPIPLFVVFNDLNMVGEIPSENGKLISLSSFELQGSGGVTGTIPDTFCDFGGFIDMLALAFTSLSGSIPSCMGDLEVLSLILDSNLLTGPIPTGLADFHLFSTFWVNDNLLTGPLPDGLKDAENMLSFQVHDNPGLTGNPIPILNGMTNISALMINNCDFEGEIDETFLANAPLVNAIDLSHNRFTSPSGLPAALFEKPILEVMDLSANLLSGPLPTVIQNAAMSPLNFVSLYDNQLSGELPSALANFPLLDHIDVSNNKFTGTLPGWIGQMSQMKFLYLSLNPFAPGPVPESYGNMQFIQELSLRGTSRSGLLPSMVGTSLTALTLLDLGSNAFAGPIPDSYGSVPNLKFLLLNDNQGIIDFIPSTFANLQELRGLYVDQTSLIGDLDTVCNLPNIADPAVAQHGIFADCNLPEITCDCDCKCFDGTGAGSQPLLGNLDGSAENEFHRYDDLPVFHAEDYTGNNAGGLVTGLNGP